jgi:elongation factor P
MLLRPLLAAARRAYSTTTRRAAADLRVGTVVEIDAAASSSSAPPTLAVVTKFAYTQGSGRQAGIVQASLRELRTGKATSARWRPDDAVAVARLEERALDVLYRDDAGGEDGFEVMDPATFEQGRLPAALLGAAAPFVGDGARVVVAYAPGAADPVSAAPAEPTAVVEVSEVPPPRSGVASSYKQATVAGGRATVGVPEYVKAGDRIVVNVADGTYVKRA